MKHLGEHESTEQLIHFSIGCTAINNGLRRATEENKCFLPSHGRSHKFKSCIAQTNPYVVRK